MKNKSMVAMDRDAELLRTALFRSMASAERRHSRELLRKNARQLGVFEAFRMRLRGYADGQHGTPRETPDHNWTSPLLQREIDAQQEHRERVWGTLQIELKPYHIRAESLLTVISAQKRKLAELRADIVSVDEEALASRKRGEEQLSDEQVGARRQRELDRRNSGILAECRGVEAYLDTCCEELAILYCFITESENTARLTCERVMDHTRQRVDAYWRASMRVHPRGEDMPVVPYLPRETAAEHAYMEQHGQTHRLVEETLEEYRLRQADGEAA